MVRSPNVLRFGLTYSLFAEIGGGTQNNIRHDTINTIT